MVENDILIKISRRGVWGREVEKGYIEAAEGCGWDKDIGLKLEFLERGSKVCQKGRRRWGVGGKVDDRGGIVSNLREVNDLAKGVVAASHLYMIRRRSWCPKFELTLLIKRMLDRALGDGWLLVTRGWEIYSVG